MQVVLPPVTEDQTQVPVTVDARALGKCRRGARHRRPQPVPLTLRLEPVAARPFVAFRMKIEQGTPIRAAVRKGETWHVGGRYLDAAGGGCSVPPVVEKRVDWKSLGETRARVWPRRTACASPSHDHRWTPACSPTSHFPDRGIERERCRGAVLPASPCRSRWPTIQP